MPPGISIVLASVINFFKNEVARHDAPDVDIRYYAALLAEIARSVMKTLRRDFFWRDRIPKVDTELIGCLEEWEAEGFPGLLVIDIAEDVSVQISNLGKRSRDVRTA